MRRQKQTLAADLRDRITIEQPVRISDGAGGYTVSWTAVDSVWGLVSPLSRPFERILDGQDQSQQVVTIRIRTRNDITTEMRATSGGRVYAITGIIRPEGAPGYLDLLAEEGVET